jgi:hypothetical protein
MFVPFGTPRGDLLMQKLSPVSLSFHSKSRMLLSMIIYVAAFAGSVAAQLPVLTRN